VDTTLNGMYEAMRRRKQSGPTSGKGTVVTRNDLEKHNTQFLLLSALYPALWTTAKLDLLLPLQAGYKLIVRAHSVAGN
jgi:hypothetical protein